MSTDKSQRLKAPQVQADELQQQHWFAMESLDGYSDFLESLQAELESENVEGLLGSTGFGDFEDYAAITAQSLLGKGGARTGQGESMPLGVHDCAAVATTPRGTIRQANQQAMAEFNLSIDKSLEDCGITFVAETDLSSLMANNEPDADTGFRFVQVYSAAVETTVTAAIAKIGANVDTEPLFLILLISPPDSHRASEILAQKFDLTASEQSVTKAFLDGVALRDIAAARGRSYTTIRNQFQSVLEKCGCASQTALFRIAFSLLQLADQTQSSETIQPPPTSTRIVTVPRPKGRVVTLALCGDDDGRPMLSLTSLFGHGITPAIEAELRRRGVLLISILRPGFGATSPVPKGQTSADCVAGDVRAVLNTLEIESCPLLARASASRSFFAVLKRLPDRITHGVLVNGLIPRNYIAGKTVASNWTNALMSVSSLSYPIATLILGTGARLLARSREAEFLQKMYQESASDQAILGHPDVVASIKAGVAEITTQGLTAGVEEIVEGFKQWTPEHDAQTPRVTLYHGKDDPNVPIAGVREFAQANDGFLTLIEEAEGGGQLCYSHFPRVLDHVFPSD